MPESARNKLAEKVRQKSFQGLLKRNQNQTKLALDRKMNIMNAASGEIQKLNDKDLLLIGAALYWAEGYKRAIVRDGKERTYHYIGLTNSDPKLIRAFIEFSKRVCNVPIEKIKANIRIFKHLNDKQVIDFWSKTTGLSKENFTKTYIGISRSSMGKRPFNRLPYGVIQIRIGDTQLFHRIMGWIEGLKNQF